MRLFSPIHGLGPRLCFARSFTIALMAGLFAVSAFAQRQMENLGRGVVAVRNTSDVFVSWRLLAFEPQDTAFNVYRSANGGAPEKLNSAPLTGGTNYTDTTATIAVANAYFVRPVLNGVELAASPAWTLPANSAVEPLFRIPLHYPPNRRIHNVWVGDLDGDGEYEFVLAWAGSVGGQTQKVQAYKRDGTLLWEMDFGPNSVDSDNIYVSSTDIAAGQQDGVTVYDLDGDGKAEVIVKTANGVTFGNGQTLTYSDDITQFISVIDGMSGAERARAELPNPWKTRPQTNRPLSTCVGIGYCDGVRPSFVIHAKNRNASTSFNLIESAWDFRNGVLSQRWSIAWDGDLPGSPENAHGIRIVDVDGDGKDDLVPGMHAVSGNGILLYKMGDHGIVHGDRFQIGDLNPNRPGLEGYAIQQNNPSKLIEYMWDPKTGQLIWTNFISTVQDAARGTASDIDPRYPGMECWSFYGLHAVDGTFVSPEPQRPYPNLAVWWDGDVLGENLNVNVVDKWNYLTQTTSRVLTAYKFGAATNSRNVPQLIGDIIGDWREEIVYDDLNHKELLVFTTNIPSNVRLYTLAQNPAYRNCLTTKGYLQQNLPDYYLGDGMVPPPRPNAVPVINTAALVPAITALVNDTGASNTDSITNDNRPVLRGASAPNAQIIISRIGVGDDGATTADSAGAWTFSYSSVLGDGKHYFTARINGQTNTSLPFEVQIDTLSPTAPAIEAVVSNGSGGVIVSGSASAGLRVDAVIDSIGAIGTTTADAAGHWSITYAGPMAISNYNVSATTMDVAGNVSALAQRVLDLTLTAPAITAVSDDTGISSSDHITTDGTITLSGTASIDAQVSIYRFGLGNVGVVQADASGAWTFNYTTLLSDGDYVFTAYSGASLGSTAFNVKIDRVAPAVDSITRVTPTAASSSDTSVVFRVSFSDAVAGVDVTDFSAVFAGGLSGALTAVTSVNVSTYDVTVDSLSGPGTLQLNLNAAGSGITDLAGNALSAGFTSGVLFTRILIGNGTWISLQPDALWGDSPNWLGGIVADGSGKAGDFSTLNITENMLVHLDTPRTLTNLTLGDTDATTPASWTITGDGVPTNKLTLVSTATPSGTINPVITVNALGTGATAMLDAPLGGTSGFTKAGAGTLSLAETNTLTGTVTVNAGSVRLETDATLTPSSVSVNNAGVTLRVAGGTLMATGSASLAGGSIIVDSGLAQFTGITGANNSGNTIRLNGGTLIVPSVSFQRSDASLNYNTGLIVAGGNGQIGSVTLGTANSHGMMSVEGGLATVTGSIRLGAQTTSGRGGHLRVTGGLFNHTDASSAGGLILPAHDTNTSTANFLGGISTVERITFGLSTLISGSGTVNVNGGALYLGAAGMAKAGGGTMTATINLTSGVLGAKAPWATDLPITLTSGGNITIKAANAGNQPQDIALTGVLSGVGDFTKIGAGTLTLGGANNATGSIHITEGTLRVTGSLDSNVGTVNVNAGGTFSGDGPIAKPIVLNSGGTVAPAGALPTTLVANAMTWNDGGKLAINLGANGVSDQLTLTELIKGTVGQYTIVLNPTQPVAPGNQFTVATFGSTTFSPNDITTTGLPDGYTGRVIIDSANLRVIIIARPVITSATSVSSVFGAPFSYNISADNQPTIYSADGLPAGLAIDSTTGVISGTLGATGTFNVAIRATNAAGTGTTMLTLNVAKANAPIVVGAPGKTTIRRGYNGTPKSATVTVEPSGLNVTYTYNGNAAALTLPGTYDVTATIDDPNYEGTSTGKLIITTGALLRHAPIVNGDLDGSVQVLSPDWLILPSGAMISGDLLVPGTPTLTAIGAPTYGGTIDANGDASPTNYVVALVGDPVLRHLVRRVNPLPMPSVDAPPQPLGTRRAALNQPDQSPGSFATLRDLTLSGNAGSVTVPPGTYGTFAASGDTHFVLGVTGATEPVVYNLQRLLLNGGTIQIVSPVLLTVARGAEVVGNDHQVNGGDDLTLRIADVGLLLNGNVELKAEVVAPQVPVIINSAAKLEGNVSADRLILNQGGLFKESFKQ